MNYLALVKTGLFAAVLVLGIGGVRYCMAPSMQSPIEPFIYERDKEQVMTLFEQDYDWLSTREYNRDYVEWVLRSHSPNEYEPEYQGKMFIDVLRDNNRVAGFVTYYLRSPFVGHILFVEVGKDFRRLGYGYVLVRHAIAALFAQGVHIVQLLTRADNFKAQRLYTRVGFAETTRNEGFVYYAITADQFAAASSAASKTSEVSEHAQPISDTVCAH